MAKAYLIKELLVKTPDKVGMLAEVTAAISKSGVNISAINAFGVDGSAMFRIVTSDNSKAAKEVKSKGFEASERDVVKLELEDKVGSGALMANKLKTADIDIKYIYGSTCGCGGACVIIFNSNDNKKAIDALNK